MLAELRTHLRSCLSSPRPGQDPVSEEQVKGMLGERFDQHQAVGPVQVTNLDHVQHRVRLVELPSVQVQRQTVGHVDVHRDQVGLLVAGVVLYTHRYSREPSFVRSLRWKWLDIRVENQLVLITVGQTDGIPRDVLGVSDSKQRILGGPHINISEMFRLIFQLLVIDQGSSMSKFD